MNRMEDTTVLRELDALVCQIWDSAGRCGQLIEVPQAAEGSHRSMADYLAAIGRHDAECHPQISAYMATASTSGDGNDTP